jgi:hypothetical protein
MKCKRTYRDSYKYADREDQRYHEREFRHEEYCPPKRWPKPEPRYESTTILKCGTNTGSLLNVGSVALAGTRNTIANGYGCEAVQSTLSLDTSDLIDAVVKFDFSALISYRIDDLANYSLILVFKLKKICDGSPITLGTWTFERSQYFPDPPPIPTEAAQNVSEPFCFSWCSCAGCADCCTYIVEAEVQNIYNIDFVNIHNISSSTLAVGLTMVD